MSLNNNNQSSNFNISWKQSTWYVFHMFTLNYLEEHREHYIRFFNAFKTILPCEVCLNHYQYQLQRQELKLDINLTSEKIFDWSVKIHNNVNASNQKRVWAPDEARYFYKNMNMDSDVVKLMVLEYVKHNFKKGPQKTDQLLIMLDSMRYIYPEEEKRNKLIAITTPLNRSTIREWLLQFLKIICDKN